MTRPTIAWVTVLGVAVAGAAVAAETGKSITLTTKSAEARSHAVEAIKRIESFQPPAQIQEPAKKAVEADPEFAFGHYLVAASTQPQAQAKPHHDKALELVQKASPGERRYLEAIALNRAQKGAEALAAFEALAVEYPQDRMVQMMVGQLSLNQGKVDQAGAAFDKAIAMDGSTARAHALAGNVHVLRGDYAKARASYEAAMSRKAPGTAPGPIHYGVAFTHLYEGHTQDALKTLEGFLEAYRKSPQAASGLPEVFIWNSMARIHLEQGKAEEALKLYDKGFQSVPGSTIEENQKKIWLGRLHHGKARTLARLGRHEEAWKEADTVKKMIDEGGEQGKQFVPAYHYVAGYLKLEAKDYPAAIEHLNQADKDDPFHRLLLARAYERSGDKVNAKKVYEEIVAVKVNNLERALAYPEARKKLSSL
jgi:tetratricopeptide (TPR) repeat protein